MTPEDQRIAIAEACGKHIYYGVLHQNSNCTVCGDSYLEAKHRVPDYLNDLNAMHEAEKMLLSQDGGDRMWRERYLHWLSVIAEFPFLSEAHQRAEAFLRTLGKWEDGK